MFQIELLIWICATLCVCIIPCIWLGQKLFVVSSKIDHTVQEEVDKIALQEQQKYDLIHEKYIQQIQEQQSSHEHSSKFEAIETLVTSQDPSTTLVSQTNTDTHPSPSATSDIGAQAVASQTDPLGDTGVQVHTADSQDPKTTANTKSILDQAQITVSGKTLDDQLKDKKHKQMYQIKQDYKLLADKSDLDAIERKLLEGLAVDPYDREINTRLADLYFWTGNHKKALTLLKKNLDQNPEEHKILRQISEISLKQGDYQQAQLIISQAINKESQNPKYYMTQAEVLYQLGDIEGATYASQQAVKLRPNNKEYLLALADLYEHMGAYEEAKQVYYRLFELDPLNVHIKEKIATLSS